jgi:hypothetical protein
MTLNLPNCICIDKIFFIIAMRNLMPFFQQIQSPTETIHTRLAHFSILQYQLRTELYNALPTDFMSGFTRKFL